MTRRPVFPRAAVARLAAVAALLLAGGCAATAPRHALPSPTEISGLERRLAADAADADARIRLGVAYRDVGRLEEALTTLEAAAGGPHRHPAAVFFLGTVYEEMERFDEARARYEEYLQIGTSRALRQQVSTRLALLERTMLRAAVRRALAEERNLAGTDPDPARVAVFPFAFDDTNPDFAPMSRALSEMLAVDLSQTDRIRVLERTRVQVLLDELTLADRGVIDPATAARGGQLLGAGRIVQGRLDGDDEQVRLQAAVVDVLGVIDVPTVREQDALRALFEVQKRFALAIYRSLGVELTPAELARIEQRPTANLQALLEYGRGLLAEDRGDFGAAADHFRRASRIDPTFQIAREQAVASRSLAASASLDPGAFGTLAMGELALPLGEINAAEILVPPIRGRDPAPEVLGVEGVGRTLILDIVIRRPQ